MHSPSAAELLTLWERGHALPRARQALLLLAAGWPDDTGAALAQVPIGQRDDRLLALRAHLFGPRLESVVACPACGETLELDLAVDALRAPAPDSRAEPLAVDADGYAVRFRLPTTEDLLHASETVGDGAGPIEVLARCVVEARHGEAPVAPEALPDAVVAAVAAQMEAADPQANLHLDLTCPACAHGWQSVFDIVSYLWVELDAWAGQMLREVHTLARAYGWHQADILAMSAARRHAYLTLVHG